MIKKSDNMEDIVHDLKTPITSIKGYMELLQQKLYNRKTREEFYSIIASETDRLLSLVNSILDTSKTEREKSGKCNISIEINKYVKELSPLADKRNVEMNINVNSESIYVSIPENEIARVLTNIIENAIKYNKESGKIFIRVYEENKNVFVKIKDTGIGIEKNEINKIFDKYYRSGASQKMNIDGSGLGLAIAKDITESYGGNIKVTSNQGGGTEFIVSFPISQTFTN